MAGDRVGRRDRGVVHAEGIGRVGDGLRADPRCATRRWSCCRRACRARPDRAVCYRGFGNLMAGLAGFYELTGWPDRTPAMIYGAYTDFVSQRFTDHRADRCPRSPATHRSRSAHRRLAARGGAAVPRPRTPRLRARRPGGDPCREPRPRPRAERGFPVPGRAGPRRPVPRRWHAAPRGGWRSVVPTTCNGRRSSPRAGLPDEPRW